MNLKKYVVTFLYFISITAMVKAQYEMPKVNDLEKLKDRQPIVVLNSRENAYLDNPDLRSIYQQVMEAYNGNLQQLTGKFWNFGNKEITYKTRAELTDMFSDKSEEDKYYLIYCFSFNANYYNNFDWTLVPNGKTMQGSKTIFAVGLPNEKPFFQVWFDDLLPTYVLLAHYISTTNFFFNLILQNNVQPNMKAFANANSDMLSKKTLLIPIEKVYPKLINNIGGYYPCKYKMVSDSEMNHAIINADSSCAYVVTSVYGNKSLINWIINCKDGAPIGYSDKGTEAVSFSNNQVSLFKNFFADIGRYCNSGQKK